MFKKIYFPALLLLVILFGACGQNSDELIKISAPELYQEFTGNESQANQQYLDKTMQVDGVLQNVTRGNDGSLFLTLNAGNPMGGVSCEVPGENIPEGLNLNTGSTITIQGRCAGYLQDVVLVKCKIVN